MVFYGQVFLCSVSAPTGTLYPSVPLRPAVIMEKGGKPHCPILDKAGQTGSTTDGCSKSFTLVQQMFTCLSD